MCHSFMYLSHYMYAQGTSALQSVHFFIAINGPSLCLNADLPTLTLARQAHDPAIDRSRRVELCGVELVNKCLQDL